MKRTPAEIVKKARRIRLLLLDVDGVLTDGGIVMDDRGEEIKRFDVRDGHGIRMLMRGGIRVGLVTGRFSRAVRHRARDLGIRMVHQKVTDKVALYQKIKRKTGLKDQEIAYVGDDIVDLPILREVGLSMAVKNCWTGLKQVVDYVTAKDGGRGAVREIAEMLLKAQGKWEEIAQFYYRP